MNTPLDILNQNLKGELLTDNYTLISYATDGSFYYKTPLAVCLPKSEEDLTILMQFALENKIALTPRTGGTSLAGQCVNDNIIVDTSKYMDSIIEVNVDNQYAIVQPGIVRDVLNKQLEPYRLFFGVNTSTSNRACIGGMVGNNSSGSLSITYGTVRENLLEIEAILSNGEEVTFKDLTLKEFKEKLKLSTLEGNIYRNIYETLNKPTNQKEIHLCYPKKNIQRRNTGYALDMLLDSNVFEGGDKPFNFCQLLAGSEGTLCLFKNIKLKLHTLPPKYTTVICAHFNSLDDCLKANIFAMEYKPYSCELIDKIILECTEKNILQSKNRFFVEGIPEAILIIEFRGNTQEEANIKAENLVAYLTDKSKGYAFPLVKGEDVTKIWELRAAGLGLLSNASTEVSAVESIEDTAVEINDLPQYIAELDKLLKVHNQIPVYYAHAGAGELHIRPSLNLKKTSDVKLLRTICKETFDLVKKYQGSISGEHGDGIIRAEFISSFYGKKIVQLSEKMKDTWDKYNLLNPGKIVRPYKMDEAIKQQQGNQYVKIDTAFDFSQYGGMLSLAEKCTGSADCRKSEIFGGLMCPSFMATRDEQNTTRARANALRRVITTTDKKDIFKSKILEESLNLCLSCKGCTSECPSNVDMAALKSEYLYQKQNTNGYSFRNKLFAYQPKLNTIGYTLLGRKLYGKLFSWHFIQYVFKKITGVHPNRKIPIVSPTSVRQWYYKNINIKPKHPIKKIYLFCDEFINDLNANIGIHSIQLLYKLNYDIEIINHNYSGRSFISKGLLKQAKNCATNNVNLFKNLINENTPLIGIEPSAILSFKDEYPRLLRGEMQKQAYKLAENTMLIDDFIAQEFKEGNISSSQFSTIDKNIIVHEHCHQKALAKIENTINILQIPRNFTVKHIPSGCCGMAGSFGYEKEHFNLSKKIANLVLLPFINREEHKNSIIAATGISCREQINDFSNKKAFHPVEILYQHLA